MSVEVVLLGLIDKGDKIYLELDDFEVLSDVVDEFHSKTGIYLDPYTDVKISPDHAGLLLSLLDEFFDFIPSQLVALRNLLKISFSNSLWVSIVGE